MDSAALETSARGSRRPRKRRGFIRGFGPGLVAGASANDPTTVGSIAVVAAATGYGLAWLVVLLLPMLAVIQSVAASVAAASQMNVQQAIVKTYGRVPATIAAVRGRRDRHLHARRRRPSGSAGADAAHGRAVRLFRPSVGCGCGMAARDEVVRRIERILAAFTLVFLCYVASAILAKPNWLGVLRNVVAPHLSRLACVRRRRSRAAGNDVDRIRLLLGVDRGSGAPTEARQFGAFKADAVLGDASLRALVFVFILGRDGGDVGKKWRGDPHRGRRGRRVEAVSRNRRADAVRESDRSRPRRSRCRLSRRRMDTSWRRRSGGAPGLRRKS